jgi:hypothetical protein
MDAAKTEVDRDVAVRHAREAHEDAVDAIEFARSAIAEAEYATLRGIACRKERSEPERPL